MIQFKNLSIFRGSLPLITDANIQLHSGWKVALIGENGCGKSSLFASLMGDLAPDEGAIDFPMNWQIAHMSQEVDILDRTALEFVIDGHKKFRQIEARLIKAEQENDHDALSKAHADYDAINGYNIVNLAEQMLSGLGFSVPQFQHKISQFSGGWRIRLNLAKTLMMPSDLLLLDEPTNHLDLEACVWLERWLANYQGSLIFVSHDRDFIDNVSDHIISFEQKTLVLYRGNYQTYEETKAQRLAQQQSAYEKQQVRINEINAFVARFRAQATKAKQAQSRLKELQRMAELSPAHIESQFTFRFQQNQKVSDPLIRIEKASIGYGQSPILNDLELRLAPGDRIGLLGVNGSGKSTLIKTLCGELEPVAGHIYQGQNLVVGYFAQHQLEYLDLDASPLLIMKRLAPDEAEQILRNFLGSFGFQGDPVDNPIRRFSGGEKARLCLAIIAWQKPNLLLLDEPTNHLDLEIRHALTLALQSYEGALLVVSHDRHLLKNTVDQYWIVHNGSVHNFEGDLNDYRIWIKDQSDSNQPENVTVDKVIDRKEQKRIQAQIRQKLSPIKKQIEKLDIELELQTNELTKIEETLAEPEIYESKNKDQLQELLKQQIELKKSIEVIETTWMELQDELEQMEQQLTT